MYVEGKFSDYIDDLASKKSAPGGGSGAAAVGALGIALLAMVVNFTVGKKKYADVEQQMQGILIKLEELRKKCEKLVDEDVAAYSCVSAAQSMPKETDEQKQDMTDAIQQALKTAMAAPLEVCRVLYEAADFCEALLEKGNQNLVSDVGVAAEFIGSAFSSALMNVEINLSSLKDKELVNSVREELRPKEKTVTKMKEEIVKRTKEKL